MGLTRRSRDLCVWRRRGERAGVYDVDGEITGREEKPGPCEGGREWVVVVVVAGQSRGRIRGRMLCRSEARGCWLIGPGIGDIIRTHGIE